MNTPASCEAILDKSDQPACQDDFPQSRIFVPEVAIPGKGHKDIGNGQEDDGAHAM
jgi:hypothetical protein